MTSDHSEAVRKVEKSLAVQGWVSIALWMSIGLLLEGLLGYKLPPYIADAQRRELFRLAHAHGALLGLLLVAASLTSRAQIARVSSAASIALRAGSLLMPFGFLLAGVWHPEGDPGLAIWLVPAGALLVVFGTISIALSASKE